MNKGCSLIVIVLITFVFIGMGLYMAIFAASSIAHEARTIQALPNLDMGRFLAEAQDAEVIITGELTGNQGAASKAGYVAYLVQRWDVDYDDKDGGEGDWVTQRSFVPALNLAMEGGNVQINSATDVTMDGSMHTVIVARTHEGDQAEGLYAGTIQHTGFF